MSLAMLLRMYPRSESRFESSKGIAITASFPFSKKINFPSRHRSKLSHGAKLVAPDSATMWMPSPSSVQVLLRTAERAASRENLRGVQGGAAIAAHAPAIPAASAPTLLIGGLLLLICP